MQYQQEEAKDISISIIIEDMLLFFPKHEMLNTHLSENTLKPTNIYSEEDKTFAIFEYVCMPMDIHIRQAFSDKVISIRQELLKYPDERHYLVNRLMNYILQKDAKGAYGFADNLVHQNAQFKSGQVFIQRPENDCILIRDLKNEQGMTCPPMTCSQIDDLRGTLKGTIQFEVNSPIGRHIIRILAEWEQRIFSWLYCFEILATKKELFTLIDTSTGEAIGMAGYSQTGKTNWFWQILHEILLFLLCIRYRYNIYRQYARWNIYYPVLKSYPGEVSMMIIDRKYRGKQLGRLLFSHICQRAREVNNYSSLIISTYPDSCNVNFYESMGCTHIRTYSLISDGGCAYDMYLYVKYLN